jgi:hypothetical protein
MPLNVFGQLGDEGLAFDAVLHQVVPRRIPFQQLGIANDDLENVKQ